MGLRGPEGARVGLRGEKHAAEGVAGQQRGLPLARSLPSNQAVKLKALPEKGLGL